MVLIQLLLPITDNAGRRFDREIFDHVRRELTDRFGGVTAYLQAPASGLWRSEGETVHDQLVLFEVLAKEFDRSWWGRYRTELEHRFQQDEILIRAMAVEVLS